MDREEKQVYAMRDLQGSRVQQERSKLDSLKTSLESNERESVAIQQAIEDGKVSSEALEAEQNTREELQKGIQNLE